MTSPAASQASDLRDLVEDFFRDRLSQVAGFEPRESQKTMARAVAETVLDDAQLAVEAETGTGKSLAYLVPLLLRESSQGRPAVIATKTLQLQDQLLKKELPLLQSLLPAPRIVVQARGWSNYLCLRKVETPTESLVRDLGPELPRLRDLAARGGGKLTKQEVSMSADSWSKVQADPLDCQKQACPHFAKCGLFAERRELEIADLIVTNHAFLLSDLRVRRDGGGLLPPCDVLVLDEAHRLDEVATDHLTVRVDAERFFAILSSPLRGWLEAVRFVFLTHLPESHLLEMSERFEQVVLGSLKDLEGLAASFLLELGQLRNFYPGQNVLPGAALTEAHAETAANLASELFFGLEHASASLDALAASYEEIAPVAPPTELARLSKSLGALARELGFLLAGDDHEWVFLCELDPPRLLARPVDNSGTLNAELFANFRSVIVTSASLKVNGSFRFFLARSGLAPARELTLASPFDPGSMTFVGLCDQGYDPGEPEYASSLSDPLWELFVGLGGRSFLLTTSHRSVQEFARLLAQPLAEAGVELLVQGQAPPGRLLQKFSQAGRRVLLGVDTFWEGVDIPGERLSCVVLTRLPFPVPTDPLFAARCQRIDEGGGRSFDELSLPLTALKLKQGFGRLLRSSSDRGVFLMLDPRICRKRYGKVLAGHLPCKKAQRGSPAELVARALAWSQTELAAETGPAAFGFVQE